MPESCDLQVCLDYWNSLVSELFEAHNNLDNPAATANMMGLQVEYFYGSSLYIFQLLKLVRLHVILTIILQI